MDSFDEFDFSSPLQYALSRLNGDSPPPVEEYAHFPKPSSISGVAALESVAPRTTMEVLDELLENLENYPKLVQLLMQRGFLKKRQQCKKCDKQMHLRRRKNAYEWRCRTRDKRDCSSCSIKHGSWFEASKLPFKAIFTFLIMHSKNCSSSFMARELKVSSHIIQELRRLAFELTDRMIDRNLMIGGHQKEVYIEIITLEGKNAGGYRPEHKVLAGQDLDSKKCFAKVLPDDGPNTIERFARQNVAAGSKITVVVTVNEQSMSYANRSAKFIDETTLPHCTMFFTNIRKSACESTTANPKTLQTFLNDQVIRRIEGTRFLEKCVNQIKNCVIHDD